MKKTFDIGDSVICDICNKDFTNSDQKGGILVLSKGVCPDCSPRFEASLRKHGELQYLKGRCPDGMSFKDWILSLRDGNNTITIITMDE